MARLSVCLLTFNSARRLTACVAPLTKVADEIIVVDSGSTDDTYAILARFGITPVQRAYKTHSDQMNHAASLAANDWVLCMDSDEILDERSVANILALKPQLDDPGMAYRISRHWHVLGRPVHAFYPVSSPDYPVRLFNRRRARFNDAPVDDKPVGFDDTRVIDGHVIHDTFYSLHEVFSKLNTYTTRLCRFKDVKPSLLDAFARAPFAFLKWYFVKGNWKDGRVGLVGGIYAFGYTFLKYFKAWYAARDAASRSAGP